MIYYNLNYLVIIIYIYLENITIIVHFIHYYFRNQKGPKGSNMGTCEGAK